MPQTLASSTPYVKFSLYVYMGVPGGPRNIKIFFMTSKIISTSVCKKIFLLKQKKIVLGVKKVL